MTPQQINHYLEQVGEPLTALKTVLNQNAEIKEFATSPLLLNVMSLVYQGCSLDEFPQLSDAEKFRQQLFGAYSKRMLQRRNNTTHQYSNAQTTRWLTWMAQRMDQTSQTVFLIERIQPSWLQTRAQRLRYSLESSMIVGLIVGLIVGVRGGMKDMLITMLIDGQRSVDPIGLIVGLIRRMTFFGPKSVDPIAMLLDRLRTGLIAGPIAGLIAGFIVATRRDIQPVETLKWSWKTAKQALLAGLIAGLIAGLTAALRSGLIVGLIAGLIVGLSVGLSVGLRGVEIQKRTKPNQGIWQSAKNAWVLALTFVLTSVLIVGLIGQTHLKSADK